MKYKITRMDNTEHGYLYYDVAFLNDAENRVLHQEDFILGISPVQRDYIGRVGPKGEVLDPDAYTTSPTDVRQKVIDQIETYIQAHQPFDQLPADRRSRNIVRTRNDPLGLRTVEAESLIDMVRIA